MSMNGSNNAVRIGDVWRGMPGKKVYRGYRCGQEVFFFNDKVDPKTGGKLRCNKG